MRKNALEPHAAEILAWNVAGISIAEQLRRLAALGVSVSRQSLYLFRNRNNAGIAEPKARVHTAVVEAAVKLTIADKQERLRRLSGLAEGMQAIIDTRGLLAKEPRMLGSGRDAYEIELERFDAALVTQYRGVLRDVAEELDQMPKSTKGEDIPTQWTLIQINNDNRQVTVIEKARNRESRIIGD